MTGPHGAVLNSLRRLKQSLERRRADRTEGLARKFFAELSQQEFESQRPNRNERSIEYRFVFDQLTRIAPVTVLDVGTGTTALPSLMATAGYVVTAIDKLTDFWPTGMFNRHFHVIDQDITNATLTERFDFVTCISVLEHIRNSDAAIGGMLALLKPGGHLALTCPYTEAVYSPNVYTREDSCAYGLDLPYVCQSYDRSKLDAWLARDAAEIVRQEFWQLYTGEFWSCGEMMVPPRQVSSSDRHQITCLLLRKSS